MEPAGVGFWSTQDTAVLGAKLIAEPSGVVLPIVVNPGGEVSAFTPMVMSTPGLVGAPALVKAESTNMKFKAGIAAFQTAKAFLNRRQN